MRRDGTRCEQQASCHRTISPPSSPIKPLTRRCTVWHTAPHHASLTQSFRYSLSLHYPVLSTKLVRRSEASSTLRRVSVHASTSQAHNGAIHYTMLTAPCVLIVCFMCFMCLLHRAQIPPFDIVQAEPDQLAPLMDTNGLFSWIGQVRRSQRTNADIYIGTHDID